MLEIIILAAGQGTRMRTSIPKLLHDFAGKPILQRVIDEFQKLNPTKIHLIVNPETKTLLMDSLSTEKLHDNFNWIIQTEQLGTAHAVQQALPYLKANSQVIISVGDVPLITAATLRNLLSESLQADLGLLLGHFNDPAMLGRIRRDANQQIQGIVEFRDASVAERNSQEIFSGIMSCKSAHLQELLPCIEKSPITHEYYLTELVALSAQNKKQIVSIYPCQIEEIVGINHLEELAKAERYYMLRQAKSLALQGVRIACHQRFDLRGELIAEADVFIDINNLFVGTNYIGSNSTIGANCILENVTIGRNVKIHPFTHIENAIIDDGASVGPFARIRPDTHLQNKSRIGNFVEVKNSTIGENSKVNHLSYIGDTVMGKNVNVGAGVVTVNYDGANKHVTTIADHVFVGCDSQLIAPVTIGEGAFIGAGSTITTDAPPGQLTLGRVKQKTIAQWRRPTKKEEQKS